MSKAQTVEQEDMIVREYPRNLRNTKELSDRIKTDFSKDVDRARAAYTWLIHNITYDIKEWAVYNSIYGPFTYRTKTDSIRIAEERNAKTLKRVLKLKRAVCFGYSLLYKELCKEMGIPCRVINGMGRTTINEIGGEYKYNHNWNIIELNGKPSLVDVTWGVDITSDRKTYQYFLLAPERFILDHYPEKWPDALLKDKVSIQHFLGQPLYSVSELKQFVEIIKPASAFLQARDDTKIQFEFYSTKRIKELSYSFDDKYIFPEFTQKDGRIEFSLGVTKGKKKRTLRIFLNNEMFVTYLVGG